MIIIGSIFLALMGILLYALFNFDSLVKIEYQRHNEDWIKDGKPRGFFWHASECSWLDSAIATNKLSFIWLFRSPQWIRNDGEAMSHLKKLRTLVLTFNIGIIIWFIVTITITT